MATTPMTSPATKSATPVVALYKKTDIKDHQDLVFHAIDWKKSVKHQNYYPVFGGFQSHDAFISWYEHKLRSGPCNGVCEIMAGNPALRLYADLDLKRECESPRDVAALKIDVVAQCNEFTMRVRDDLVRRGVVHEGWQPRVAVADGSRFVTAGPGPGVFKASMHVVFQNVFCANGKRMGEYVSHLLGTDGSTVLPSVDMAVYRQGFSQMRLVGSHKWDDETRTPLSYRADLSTPGVELCVRSFMAQLVDVEASVEAYPPQTNAVKQPPTKTKKMVPSASPGTCPRAIGVSDPQQLTAQAMKQCIVSADIDDNVVPWLQNRLGSGSIVTRKSRVQEDGTDSVFYTIHPTSPGTASKCPVTDATHSSNGGWAWVSPQGAVYMACHSQKCKGLKVCLGTMPVVDAVHAPEWLTAAAGAQCPVTAVATGWNSVPVHAPEWLTDRTEAAEAMCVSETDEAHGIAVKTFGAEVQFVQPYVFDAHTRCLCVAAGMGMGKTTQLQVFIEQYCAPYQPRVHSFAELYSMPLTHIVNELDVHDIMGVWHQHDCNVVPLDDPKFFAIDRHFRELAARAPSPLPDVTTPKRVLIITCRQTLAAKYKFDMSDFKHYKLDAEHEKADRVICQFESLHTLQRTFDLVVLDEVRSLLCCAASAATNGGNMAENLSVFEVLLQQASLCIAMDADLLCDTAVTDALCNFYSKDEMVIHRYAAKRLVYNWHVHSDEAAWLQIVKRCVQQGEKVAIVCRTRKPAEELYRELAPLVAAMCVSDTDEGVFLCTGDSADADKAKWGNPDVDLCGYQVVIYTSTVTVGCSATYPIDRVFVHAKSRGGANAREIQQMVGRFRSVRHKTIHAHVQDYLFTLPYTQLEKVLGDMKWRRLQVQKYADAMQKEAEQRLQWQRKVDADRNILLSPSWSVVNYAHALDEQNALQFGHRLRRLVEDYGGRMVMAFDGEAPAHATRAELQTPAETNDVKKAPVGGKVEMEEAWQLVQDMNGAERYAVRNRVFNAKASAVDKQVHAILNELALYEDGAIDTLDAYVFATDNRQQVLNLRDVGMGSKELRSADIDSGTYLDLDGTPRGWAVARLREMCNVLGLKNVMDETTAMPVEVFEQNKYRLLQLTTDIKRMCKLRWWHKGTDPIKCTNSVLDSLLGASLSGVRKRKKGEGRCVSQYHVTHDAELCKLSQQLV